ncbi:unnamed protein product [Enterobius vermicularis]|uniref:Uncharacterized protein n=1 Tax=Enterobius vermicularis TaxID=51028 RepID=A0A3P6J588_ENTVE|nr:unnamed protein product [Enterobius vermicularis]
MFNGIYKLRFSPDGKYLVCFLCDYHTVSVRNYVGYHKVSTAPSTNSLFDVVFPERFSLNLCLAAREASLLNYNCVFFTQDSKYLIVATEAQVPEYVPTISQVYLNNESLQPLSSQSLNTVCFYCINLEVGNVCDTFTLMVDRVWVAHGVHLVGRIMAVLSLQQQTIHIMQISDDGHFTALKQLGKVLYEDDSYRLASCYIIGSIVGMKQRLLSVLYEKARREGKIDQFLHNFDYLCGFRIWQLQFVLPDVLLLRFVKQDAFASNATINSQPAIFVFMNWRSSEIIAVFNKYSDQFLWIVENFYEHFKNPHVLDNRFPMTMQHCIYDYERHCRLKHFYGINEGVKVGIQRQILSCLPYSTAYAPIDTPYLDPAMFKYDDMLLTFMDRKDFPPNERFRFFSRVTSQPVFDIKLSGKRSVQLLFHPYEPFAFSFDRSIGEGTGTFHVPYSALQSS